VAEARPGSRQIRPAKCPIDPEMFDDTSNPENAHLYHANTSTVPKSKAKTVRKSWKKPGQVVKSSSSDIGVESAKSKSNTKLHREVPGDPGEGQGQGHHYNVQGERPSGDNFKAGIRAFVDLNLSAESLLMEKCAKIQNMRIF